MAQSTITDKFQTTLPQEVRTALGLKPRQRISYELRDDGSAIIRAEPTIDSLFGSLKPKRKISPAEEKKAARAGIGRLGARAGRELE